MQDKDISNEEPGVSGKDAQGNSWANSDKYKEQKKFMDKVEESEKGYAAQGRGQNQYGRTNLENQEHQQGRTVQEDQVIEALKRSPEADIEKIQVRVNDGTVILEGFAESINEVREMENIVKNIPGVIKVISHIELKENENQKLRH